MEITKGRVDVQQKNVKGWLVGQFLEPPFKDDNVEIYCKTFPVGNPQDQLHYHPQGQEYLIVIKGRAKMKIGDETTDLNPGDYLGIPANTPDQLLEIIEELTLIGVRYPSIPDNKVFL